MSDKKCPDCGGDLWITDGEYDTIYSCKDRGCNFSAHSDAEYEMACESKQADDVIEKLRAEIAHLREAVNHNAELARQEQTRRQEAERWTSLDEKWPDEAETVQIWLGEGEVYPAYWQEEQEGDWENGYKKYRQWYYPPDWDVFEPLDFGPRDILWKPMSEPPKGSEP